VWEETMASNSVLKSARDSGFHEGDPLAELSRIMGLAREDAANADADFHIDLEQELMGAFSDEEPLKQANDAVAPAAPVQATAEVAVESEFDEVFSDIFEQEAFEAPLDLAPATADEITAPVAAEEPSDSFFEEDFVEAFAADDLAEADGANEAELAPIADVAAARADEEAYSDIDLDFADDIAAVAEHIEPAFDPAVALSDGDDETDELAAAFRDLDVAAEQSYEAARAYAAELETVEPVVASVEPEAAVVPQMNAQPAMSLEDELAALLGVTAPAPEQYAQPVDLAEDTADEIAVESYGDDTISAEFDAGYDDADAALQGDWTAEDAADELFAADHGDDVLPNPLAVVSAEESDFAPTFAEVLSGEEAFDEIAFDEADLDFALSDVDEVASEEIVAHEPEAPEFDAADDLDAAIAEFADESTWAPEPTWQPATAAPAYAPAAVASVAPVAESRAPVSSFNWQTLRSEPAAPVAERAPQPVVAPAPDIDDSDPFAALAALAAAPPIVRALGRTNPVAVNPPTAERTAPRTIAPVEASRSFAAPRPVPMPVPAAVDLPPVQRAEPVLPRPAAPAVPLGLRPALPTSAATSSFAAPSLAARPVAETLAARPVVAAPAAPAFDGDIPDLDDLLDSAIFAPDIDTVEIQDGAVALADELDIPDFAQDVPASHQPQFDDLDDDFTNAFNQLSSSLDQRATARPERGQAAAAPTYYVDRSAPAAPAQPAPTGYSTDDYDAQLAGFDSSMAAEDPFADNDAFAVDPYDDDLQNNDSRPVRNRGVLIAAIVAGVAIVGGIGAFALSSGGSGDDVPALVKADTAPVKVKPETPGGVVVPNQDGKVYEQVSGAPARAPAQENLISGAEEPLAPAAPVAAAPAAAPSTDTALPGVAAPQVKSEERVTSADTGQTPPDSQDVTAMTPKKVRTMIVRPDGTLVAREELPAAAAPNADAVTTGMTPAPMAAAEPALVPIPSAVPGAQDDVSILPAEDAAPTVAAPAAEDVIVPAPRPTRAATPAAEPARAATPEPARAAAPEAAPAAEPTVEVASAPAAAAASLWSVQIASQPTREGAQASYEDLARRYGSVLGGKGVNIIQAEVSGKGTMWRVRVPSASKNDANILCAKLKTAGGSCFVSQ
jgi:hypothetical protein